jgi:hypothetical protein
MNRHVAITTVLAAALSAAATVPLDNPALPPVETLEEPDGGPVELVRDGKLRFCIVGDFAREAAITGPVRGGQTLTIQRFGRDSRKRCANLLRECFSKTVGVAPEIFEFGDPKATNYPCAIICGKCTVTEALGMDPDALPPEGFEVRTFQRQDGAPWPRAGVAIAGMDGFEIPGFFDDYNWRCGRISCNGTELGGVDFAERFLGVRKYAADDKKTGLSWEHFPSVRDLVVAPCAYRDHPRQRMRGLRTPWRNGTSTGFFGGEFPSPSFLIKMHPDKLEDIFYRDQAGRLWCDAKSYGGNFLDVSNPKLADILVDDFKAYYAKGGDEANWGTTWAPCGEYLWFGQCDKGLNLENEHTAKIPPAKGEFAMSEVYGHFYRYFAGRCREEIPGKTVVLMAYANYLEAPQSIDSLPDNVQILCCLGSPVFVRSPHFVKMWKETFGGWNRLTAKKCVPYTYDAGYEEDEAIQQAICGYFEGEFYRALDDFIDPSLTYNCMYRGGAPYHYSAYLASRCMWNPDFDVDAAIREYFRLMYGPAAVPLTDFYYGLLDRWINHYLPHEPVDGASRKGSIPSPNKNVFHFQTFEEGAARRLLALLDKAGESVAPDSEEGRRVTWFSTPFRNQLEDIIAFQHLADTHLEIPRAKAAPAIDGDLGDEVWKGPWLPAFRRAYAGGDRKVMSPETAIAWDDNGLYVAIRSPQPYRSADALWKGDSFEVFVAPLEKAANLYQFVIDPDDHYEDYWKQVDPPRGKDVNWRAPEVRHAARKADDAWTGELFIPWGDLASGERPKAGDVWRMNLIYNRKSPAEYTSLTPTQNNNHRIDLYAFVKFRE